MNLEAEADGANYRSVVCMTHDETFYAPREQETDWIFQRAFSISLLGNGAIRTERGRFVRMPPHRKDRT